jgi:hypothetical protein
VLATACGVKSLDVEDLRIGRIKEVFAGFETDFGSEESNEWDCEFGIEDSSMRLLKSTGFLGECICWIRTGIRVQLQFYMGYLKLPNTSFINFFRMTHYCSCLPGNSAIF